MVSPLFLFWYIFLNVLFLLNFLLPIPRLYEFPELSTQKSFLNLETACEIVIFAHFLIFLCSLCSIELQIFQIFAPFHTPNFIHSYFTFLFSFFVLFFIILLFTTVFIIFISHYKQHHLLFQIFLFCNFAYSCCLRLHF